MGGKKESHMGKPDSRESSESSESSSSGDAKLTSRTGRENQRYADNGARLVVGVVPVTADGDVVLITSGKSHGKWIIPKGGWESDETEEQCAHREALEEAGVRGELLKDLGSIDFLSSSTTLRFKCFLMKVTEILPSWSESYRIRKTVSIKEALDIATKEEQVHFLKIAEPIISQLKESRN